MTGFAQPALTGGFEDSVHGAQAAFRSIMDAMARPGTIHECTVGVLPPAPLDRIAGLVALALCDNDTPIWLDPGLKAVQAVQDWLTFHTGAPISGEKLDAAFCFLSSPQGIGGLQAMAQGTQEYPDRSATVVIQVDGFLDEPDWTLTGPGIREALRFRPAGLDDAFPSIWAQNTAQFPRGVDLIFVSRDRLAALPRTTRITTMGEH